MKLSNSLSLNPVPVVTSRKPRRSWLRALAVTAGLALGLGSQANAALDCTNTIVGLLQTTSNNDVRDIYTLNQSTNPYTRGTSLTQVPTGNSGNNYALAVAPDGKYYVPTSKDGLRIYDSNTGTWTSVPYTGVTAPTNDPLRAAMAPGGTLYFSFNTNLWSYNTSTGTFAYKALTFTDTSGLTPAPTLNVSGDFLVDSQGNLLLLGGFFSPSQTDPNRTSIGVDIFKFKYLPGV